MMIRRIQEILIAIGLVFLFFLSLVLLFQMSRWQPLANFGQQVIAGLSPGAQVLILLLALALVLAVGVLWLRELREEVFFTRESGEGSITIIESAITRYIRQVAPNIQAVRIGNTPQGLVVDLFVKVRAGEALPRVEQQLRARVREALEQTLGVGGVAAINVIVRGFQRLGAPAEEPMGVTDAKPAPAPAPPAAEERREESWVQLSPRTEAEDVKSEPPAETPEPGSGETRS